MTKLSRRAFLTGTVLISAGPIAAIAAPGVTGAGPFISAVVVDVDRLRALGLGPAAELVRAALSAELGSMLAERIGGSGARLVVRVTGLSLSSYAGDGGGGGGNGGRGGGGGYTDYLEGEALLVGPLGEIIARHPQLLALPSSSGGAWYDPESERRRIVILSRYYAQWLQRKIR